MKVVLVSGVFPPEHTFSAQPRAQTGEALDRMVAERTAPAATREDARGSRQDEAQIHWPER